MNKDNFQSSAPKSSTPTQRLPASSTGALPRASTPSTDGELFAKAVQLITRIEPRIELMIHVCKAAKLPMPGVLPKPFKHPLPPNARQTIEYLVEVFAEDPKLAQSVQVAIFRCQQVGAALVQPAGIDLDQLRRNVFFLTNLPMELKRDRILAVLFPPASTRTGVLAPPTASPEEKRKALERRDEGVKKAIALGQALAARMVVARLALETVDKGLGHNVGMVLTPEGRQAKVLAMALTGDADTVARLREAYQRYEALKAAVVKVRAGELDLEALRPIVLPLGQLATTFKDHAILRTLFSRPV
ncbi:MAG: hypothetical protein JWM80_3183 [Cyanobacteria bacterium RYN_339]|nr:hypothetical protein [Cyanobacteria bacterium RYN_339]